MLRRKIIAVILAGLMVCMSALAQSTKVKGRVTDAATGEGIPFVAVYYEGTTIGISTDLDGYYTLETRDPAAKVLCASILGYESQSRAVKQFSFQQFDFALKPIHDAINASVVKPDNRRMKRILRKIDENREKNDPERSEGYVCDIYNKMEIDMTNPDEQFFSKGLHKAVDFVFQYVDTSVISGQPYLPVMISESKVRKYRSGNPEFNKEVILANRISGIDSENFVSQFTGSLHFKNNPYSNFINLFDVEIPSPLSPGGALFYDYYLIDSLQVAGRKTYYIRYHPAKMVSTPVFDGEMRIDAEEYALVSFHGKLAKKMNINWVRDFALDIENQRLESGRWFHKDSYFYLDFSTTLRDSSKIVSLIGTRTLHYETPELRKPTDDEVNVSNTKVTVKSDAVGKDEAFWEEARPYPLSQKEQGIYKMVDEIKETPLYRDAYALANIIINGYWDFPKAKIGIGQIMRIFSFNNLEGFRLRMGVRTTKDFSEKVRLMAYGAYGFKDKQFKGGAEVEYLFRKEPWRKLTFSATHDALQLGQGTKALQSNFFGSILAKGGRERLSPAGTISVTYEHELPPFTNLSFAVEGRRIWSNAFVPMVLPDNTVVPYVTATQLHLTSRFAWEEAVLRGNFLRNFVHSDYPIVSIDLMGALKGVGSDYSYLRAELSTNWKVRIPPIGASWIKLNAGKIFGAVPYPYLKLHEGNASWYLDKTAFSTMNFYEFASDTWATVNWEHNFFGFFLGKIPLLKRLQWRESIMFKMAWGTVSDRNNGQIGTPQSLSAPMLFPASMQSLEKPYIEVGAGINNIFRIFRVDVYWRLTHRTRPGENGEQVPLDGKDLLAINAGFDFRF